MPESINPVKDQVVCGSCWAFSLVSALEFHWYIRNGECVTRQEQFVIDCTWDKGVSNSACDGGLYDEGAKEIVKRFNGVVPYQSRYGTYLSTDGQCYMDDSVFQDVNTLSESESESVC